MAKYGLSDKEKLERIIEVTGISRSALAKRLEVSYKTVYRVQMVCDSIMKGYELLSSAKEQKG